MQTEYFIIFNWKTFINLSTVILFQIWMLQWLYKMLCVYCHPLTRVRCPYLHGKMATLLPPESAGQKQNWQKQQNVSRRAWLSKMCLTSSTYQYQQSGSTWQGEVFFPSDVEVVLRAHSRKIQAIISSWWCITSWKTSIRNSPHSELVSTVQIPQMMQANITS